MTGDFVIFTGHLVLRELEAKWFIQVAMIENAMHK